MKCASKYVSCPDIFLNCMFTLIVNFIKLFSLRQIETCIFIIRCNSYMCLCVFNLLYCKLTSPEFKQIKIGFNSQNVKGFAQSQSKALLNK